MAFSDGIKNIRDLFLGRPKNNVYTSLVSSGQETTKTKEKYTRIPKDQLEFIYIRDSVIFNGINTYVCVFSATPCHIKAKNKSDQRVLDDFIKNSNLQLYLNKAVLDMGVYGNSWDEIIYSKPDKDGNQLIVGLDAIDSKSMDFMRDKNGIIVYNKEGNIESYFQEVPMEMRNSIPENKKWQQESKYGKKIEEKRVLQIPFLTVGDSPCGIGLIEPLFETVKISLNIEEGLGQATYKTGFPTVVVYVGDERHNPTQEMIDDIADKIQDMSFKNQFTMPYYAKMEILEPKTAYRMGEYLTYFNDLKITSLGVPKPYVTGRGEDTNKSILDFQNLMFERRLASIQNSLRIALKDKLFSKMKELGQIKEIPDVEWDDINIESLDSRSERLQRYVQSNLLIPDKGVRDAIRASEKLPEEDDDLNETPKLAVQKQKTTKEEIIVDNKKG